MGVTQFVEPENIIPGNVPLRVICKFDNVPSTGLYNYILFLPPLVLPILHLAKMVTTS